MTHLSLCTGIGGLDLAAERAGFTTIGQAEVDDYASKVLAKHFKGVRNYGDITTITNDRYPELMHPTAISAGFPCQPYSLAGKGKGDGDSRDLWSEVARVVGELQPTWFVGENTPGLFSRENQRYFHRVVEDLTQMGYCVSWGIWGACDVGAPHKRDRVFIVAYSDGNDRQVGFDWLAQLRSPWTDGAGDDLGIHNSRWHSSKLSSWWATEPNVGRLADGVPRRVDRLRCLGNAVVEQQAYPIFEAIAEIEKLKEGL